MVLFGPKEAIYLDNSIFIDFLAVNPVS